MQGTAKQLLFYRLEITFDLSSLFKNTFLLGKLSLTAAESSFLMEGFERPLLYPHC